MTPRHDPGAEPRELDRRPRRSALFGRQIVPVLHVEAAPDPVDDEMREWCTVADVPTVARAVGVEAYRQQVDAMALDPSHGIAQADGMRDARRRRAHEIAWATVKDIDGPLMPATIARLVIEALERDGVL